jgi:O-antigen/teichoic acid export membrane protein
MQSEQLEANSSMSTAPVLIGKADERPLPSLTSNFIWTLGGNLIYSASQWGMLSILAKRGSPPTVGVFALGLAVSAPVFMLCNLQLRGVQATDAQARYQFADFFMLRSLCTLVALLFIGGLSLVEGYRGEVLVVLIALSLAKAFESWSDVVAGLLQRHERLDLAARAVSVRGVVSLVVFASVFVTTRKLSVACIGLAVTWAAVVGAYDMALARGVLQKGEGFFSASTIRMWELLKKSLPLGVVMALISLNTNLPRYMLMHYLGAGQLGIFASIAYLLTAVNLLALALGQAASARMATMFVAGELGRFRDVIAKLAGFGVAIGGAACGLSLAFGRTLLTLLYGASYSSHRGLLLILAATAGISTIATFMGVAATSAQSFRAQVPVIAATTITTLAGSWLLVPLLGLDGAGIALLISAMVQLAGLTLVTWNAMNARRELL